MGVLDKIKNALFEVEYVEVEEPVKKEKKVKSKGKTPSDKPIAKKIVLPGKKEEKVEELQEEELKDDNFEARPKDETIKENTREDFKYMDDKDFRMDDEYVPDEPEIVKVLDKEEEEKPDNKTHDINSSRREDRYKEEDNEPEYSPRYDKSEPEYSSRYDNSSIKNTSRPLYSANRESKPYGMDSSYSVPVHEYGTYDKRDEKTYFKPSPIISPIYGILDKNYKKEDVVQKKEIRLTTNYTRSNVSVDDVRNKAYGEKHLDEIEDAVSETTFEVEEEEDNLLVDLNADQEKPSVKEVTMGDALEYFQDLGLEYNVDYVDATKERSTPKRAKDNYDDLVSDIEDGMDKSSENHDKTEKKENKKTIEVKEESKATNGDSDDDNLFDLIDSMYQDNN